jgi:GT2 family glycosyltransferase
MRKHAKHGGDIFYLCLPRCIISPSSAVIHQCVFEKVGVFDEALPACEDYDLWLRICALYPVLFVPEALLVKYGGHEDQLSRRHWGMDRFRIQALEKMLSMDGLSAAHRKAVLDRLLEKLYIVLKGARKHNNVTLVRDYSVKRFRYQQLLDGSQDSAVQPPVIGHMP